MSDPRDDFDRWLAAELRRPLRAGGSSRGRVMDRVRAEARLRPAADRVGRRTVDRRRGRVAGHPGALLAAGLVGVLALGAVERTGRAGTGFAPPVAEAAIRDTLRLVRFVLAAPTASSVALVGDFNDWSRRATPLAAQRDGAWAGAVALPSGRHRYAFVVDDTQWVADPAAPSVVADSGRPSGRPTSALFVAGAR